MFGSGPKPPGPETVAKLPNPATQADPSVQQAGVSTRIPGAAQFGNGTIMTSPMGVLGTPFNSGKSLLGQ